MGDANTIVRTYTNFSGGLNTKQVPPIVTDNGELEALQWSEVCKNWEQSETGLLKSYGNAAVISSASSGTVTGIFEYKNGNDVELIVCKAGKVFTVLGSTETEIYTGDTAGYYYTSTEWDDGSGNTVLILCNGQDTPIAYDGTTCAQISFTDPDGIWNNATPHSAEVFRGRIFFADGTKVYTPASGTYTDFTSANGADAFEVDGGFGGRITGLKALTDNLLVIFKERAIRRLSGSESFGSNTDPFVIAVISNNVGCIARRSIVQSGKGMDIYFLSEDGVRQLEPVEKYGDIDPFMPSYVIQDEVNEWNYTAGTIDDACGALLKKDNHIYMSVPYGSSPTNNKTYIFDTITKGVDPRGESDFNVSAAGVYNRKLYTGDSTGQIYKWGDDNGYNGNAITATWESKFVAHINLSLLKKYDFITLYSEADADGDVIIRWTVIQGNEQISDSSTGTITTGTNVWDSAVWDTAVWETGSSKVFHIKDIGRGHALKLEFENVSASQRPKIRQVDMGFVPLSHARQ